MAEQETKGKYKYLAKNTVIFAISTFGTKLLSFLFVPLYTSVLSTSEYGVADIITTTSFLLVFIFTIDISDAVLRFGIDSKDNKEGILLYGIKVLLTGGIIAAFCLAVIAYFNPLGWKPRYYLFLFLIYVLQSLNDITDKYLRAVDRVRDVAIASIILTAVTITSNLICLLVLKLGLDGYLISFTLSYTVAAAYRFSVVAKCSPSGRKTLCDIQTRREMRAYCIPLIFNGIIWWMNGSLDRFFLTGICGSSANGLYAVASKIPTILTVCASVFQQAWGLSALHGYDSEDSDGFFSKTYSTYNALLVLASSAIMLINIPLASVMFSKDFFVAWKYSSVLLISALFSTMASFTGSVFAAAKDTKIYTTSSVLSVVVNIILNATIIPIWGIQGATIATAASYVVMWAMRFALSRRYMKWRVNIVRDVVAYLLLIAQIFLEHTSSHSYLLQVGVLALLCVIYHKQLKTIVGLVLEKIKEFIQKRKSHEAL